MNLAQLVDAVPVVQTTADRGLKFPSPAADQRVFNKQTGNIERWDVLSSAWVVDVYGSTNIRGRMLPAYGPNIVIDLLSNSVFEIVPTDGVAFTVGIPLNPNFAAGKSQQITLRIKNTFGVLGVMTLTGGPGGYRIGAAWVQPANGFSRIIAFDSDGTNWIESYRSPADVAN